MRSSELDNRTHYSNASNIVCCLYVMSSEIDHCKKDMHASQETDNAIPSSKFAGMSNNIKKGTLPDLDLFYFSYFYYNPFVYSYESVSGSVVISYFP